MYILFEILYGSIYDIFHYFTLAKPIVLSGFRKNLHQILS